MSFLGMKLDFSTIVQLGLAAATGGASLAVMAQQMAMQQIGMQLLQKAGEELGLPPVMIQAAQTAFLGSAGFSGLQSGQTFANFAQANGISPQVQGIMERAINSGVQESSSSIDKFLQDELGKMNLGNEKNKLQKDISRVMNGKGSLLMKLATALGMIADDKMQQMAAKTAEIGQLGELDKKNQAKYSELSGQIQALGQEMSIVSQAMSNVLKTVGEATSSIARKG